MKTFILTALSMVLASGTQTLFTQDSISIAATHTSQQQQAKKTPPPDFVQYEKAPELLKKVEPEYPAIALKAGLEGTVWVKVWVDELGNVVEASVLKSDEKIFDEAAKIAASRWKFSPAISKGQPVAVWVTIPFRFGISTSTNSSPAKRGEFLQSLQSLASKIIQGINLEQVKSSIDPGAYVIDGNHYENLWAVLSGEIKTCQVVDGPNAKINYFNAYATNDMSTVSMVLKSISADGRRERYHTVLFVREPTREWKVKSWHVSG
jgi:TonB family protein